MPTLEENLATWHRHNWAKNGDEWSKPWGTTTAAWYGMLLPRIHNWVRCGRALEIAPGYGRWTQFLKDFADELIIVDLVEKCIDGCRQRFAQSNNVQYFVNDGRSLEMVAEWSVDFVFSFDSLVHAEADVMQAYLEQLAMKLSRDGVAFMHHSNAAALPGWTRWLRWLSDQHWRLAALNPDKDWRALSVSAALVKQWAAAAGLQCRSQEIVTWGTPFFSDCLSVITRRSSKWARSTVVSHNPNFMRREAPSVVALEHIYS